MPMDVVNAIILDRHNDHHGMAAESLEGYSGGNPSSDKSGSLPGIRSWIFDRGTGNVSGLLGSNDNFGTYRVLGNLNINIDHGVTYQNYRRALDLENGVYTTSYQTNHANYTTSLFCSYPADVCVYRIASSATLPKITAKFENKDVPNNLAKASCGDRYARYSGVTQQGPPEGLKYDAVARIAGSRPSTCSGDGTLTAPESSGVQDLTFVIGADTNYDASKGTSAHGYSFKGVDPGPRVESVTTTAAGFKYDDLLSKHTSDYQALFGAFTLSLPDPRSSAKEETAKIISRYSTVSNGDPFVEGLLFDYSRYLLITSSRENSLPSNLQGRWAEDLKPDWGADYHANINLQMNYWTADQTGLQQASVALWNYMANTWVPRGTETAKLLYNAPGWVTHNEMNVFGHTAMKSGEGYANYPVAAAWMMQHVWDNFEYGQNIAWLKD
ncbi:alpha-fucosidase [Purpureocillium lavendulum]|uniref:Alpha-fucosidase n=1 Tax=Purpureocillium lavendulum TaxID=1247861 RepID=A0AB34FAQ7_9HYPO|nr:alpha-fucosidase [Purpureocillium lavendulum]